MYKVYVNGLINVGMISITLKVVLQHLVRLRGETKPQHFESLRNREWPLGDTKVEAGVEEFYEYKKLRVLKNYIGSFSSNIDDNIDKTRKKVGYDIFFQF